MKRRELLAFWSALPGMRHIAAQPKPEIAKQSTRSEVSKYGLSKSAPAKAPAAQGIQIKPDPKNGPRQTSA